MLAALELFPTPTPSNKQAIKALLFAKTDSVESFWCLIASVFIIIITVIVKL